MLKKINHIGIAVPALDGALPLYRDALGMVLEGTEEVSDQKVRVAFLAIGESRIELLEPTSAESPIAKFLEKAPAGGIHHIAYEVDDIEKAIAAMQNAGIRLVDTVPRVGAHQTRIAFLHPKSTGGVLTELCQKGH